MYFKPRRKIKDFVSLSDLILPVWVKIGHLKEYINLVLYTSILPEYACTYEKQKGILSPGRLYATENYLCFYANIFGQETYLTIQWKNVKTLTEEKAAFVFPNAIQVVLLEKYISIPLEITLSTNHLMF